MFPALFAFKREGYERRVLSASYVLPLRADRARHDLVPYLRVLVEHVADVLVVDGSEPAVFAAQQACWPAAVRHLPVDTDLRYANGKVNGVLTGLRAARHDRVVLADDDVRYDTDSLTRLIGLLGHVDVAIPQNYFDPLPWHAAWDTARGLLNRALGHDYPGTLGVRRDLLLAVDGYDGNALFENLELLRTVRAAGGTVHSIPDLFVRRLPPSTRHFLGQRVRQAYDSFAQPPRLAAELAILPILGLLARRREWTGVAGAVLATAAVAEMGRRRDNGRAVFPASSVAWAPAWLLERGAGAWVALACRLVLGSVPYPGLGRLRHAATPQRVLDRRLRAAQGAMSTTALL